MREDQAALVAWLRRPRVVWSEVAERLEECGSVHAAAADAPAQLSLSAEAGQAASDLERWGHVGIRMVSVLDAEYPANLRMIHQRPPVLFMRGTADQRDATSVAIVGTRQPTPRGLDQACQLATGLAARGVPIVSGLASGIDTAAHAGALAVDARTVAVIGTGIDRVYPPPNAALTGRGTYLAWTYSRQLSVGTGRFAWGRRGVTWPSTSGTTVSTAGAASSGRHALSGIRPRPVSAAQREPTLNDEFPGAPVGSHRRG